MKEKIKNAYILFYERILPTKEEELPNPNLKKEESKDTEIEEKTANDSKTQKKTSSQQNIETFHPDLYQEEFLQEILRDNLKFHVHKSIFSNEFFSFVVQLVNNWKFEENSDYLEPPFLYIENQEPKKFFNLEILKFGVLFFLTCMAREKEKHHLAEFLPELKKALAGVIKKLKFSENFFIFYKIITRICHVAYGYSLHFLTGKSLKNSF